MRGRAAGMAAPEEWCSYYHSTPRRQATARLRMTHDPIPMTNGHNDSRDFLIIGAWSLVISLPGVPRQAAAENSNVAVGHANVLQFAGVKAPVIFGIDCPAVRRHSRMLVIAAHSLG